MPDPPVLYQKPVSVSHGTGSTGVEIRMRPTLKRVVVRFAVRYTDRTPARKASVIVRDGDGQQVDADVDSRGRVSVRLVQGVRYTAQAYHFLETAPDGLG
jgi:hypothetical protein